MKTEDTEALRRELNQAGSSGRESEVAK